MWFKKTMRDKRAISRKKTNRSKRAIDSKKTNREKRAKTNQNLHFRSDDKLKSHEVVRFGTAGGIHPYDPSAALGDNHALDVDKDAFHTLAK